MPWLRKTSLFAAILAASPVLAQSTADILNPLEDACSAYNPTCIPDKEPPQNSPGSTQGTGRSIEWHQFEKLQQRNAPEPNEDAQKIWQKLENSGGIIKQQRIYQ